MKSQFGTVGGVALLALTACSGGTSDDDKGSAVDVALATFGDCLNIAGYDVDRSSMIKTAGPGTGSGHVLVYFMNEKGGDAIRVDVVAASNEVAPLDGGDESRLAAADCT